MGQVSLHFTVNHSISLLIMSLCCSTCVLYMVLFFLFFFSKIFTKKISKQCAFTVGWLGCFCQKKKKINTINVQVSENLRVGFSFSATVKTVRYGMLKWQPCENGKSKSVSMVYKSIFKRVVLQRNCVN